MSRRSQAAGVLVLALLVFGSLPAMISAATPVNVKLTYNASPVVFHYPEDLRILRNVTVVNQGSSHLEMLAIPTLSGTNASLATVTVFPQGAGLVLQPGEVQTVSVLVDLSRLVQVWRNGASYYYNISLEVGPITVGPGCAQPNFCIDHTRSQTANLTDQVQVLCTCLTLPPNTYVSGRVFDRATAAPISGARVEVQGSSLTYAPATTDSNGFYNISVTAFRSADTGAQAPLDLHATVPGSGFYSADSVVYPQPGSPSNEDFLMDRATQNSTYTVYSKFVADGSLDLGRGAFSGNGSFMAAATFNPGGASQQDIAQNSSLYFFSANGTLLWKFRTYAPTSAVDVSDDAKYVTVGAGAANQSKPQVAEVFDTSGRLLWFKNATRQATDNLSIYWSPDYWTTLKFSHDDRYLAAGTSDGYLFLYSMASQQAVWEKFLGGQVNGVRFNSDNSVVYVSSGNGFVYAFSTGAAATQFWQTYAIAGADGFGVSSNYLVLSPRTGNYIELLNPAGSVLWRAPVEASYPTTKIALNQANIVYFGSSAFPFSGVLNISGSQTLLLGAAATGTISLDANYFVWSGIDQSFPGGGMSVVLYDFQGHAVMNYTDSTDAQPGCGGGPSWIGSKETRITVTACDSVYFFSGYVTTAFSNPVVVGGQTFDVGVVSNSTVYNFSFDPVAQSLTFGSTLQSDALFDVTIPYSVLSGNFTVTAGANVLPATVTQTANSTELQFVCKLACSSIVISAAGSTTTTTTTSGTTTSTTSTNSTTSANTGPVTTTVTVTQSTPTASGPFQASGLLLTEAVVATVIGAAVVVLALGRRRRGAPSPPQPASG